MTAPTAALMVERARLEFVEHPRYADAHPGEPCAPDDVCTSCARARRPDTGETVLLWLAGGLNWVVSRHDPAWERHRADFATGILS